VSTRLSPRVKCQLCFERYRSLVSHLRTHKRNTKSYKEEFNAPVVSPLTLHRMRVARFKVIKRKNPDAVFKKAATLGFTGRQHSPETIEKIRQSHLGRKLSEEHRLAISMGMMGHEVSAETRKKISQQVITDEMRKQRSELQRAERGSAWKGGVSRYLYMGKGKFRLKKIFGEPLHCFFPGCTLIEGVNVKSVDCHHLDGNHENNPLDGANWLPLCRRHHMLADGRLGGSTKEEVESARKSALEAHRKYMENHYVGEIKSYHQ